MDYLCGFSLLNLRLSSSFIDKVNIDIPIMDFLSRPHLHVKANSLYATLSLMNGQKNEELPFLQQERSPQKISLNSSPVEQTQNNQEESILASLSQKIARNLNVELKKAKIILFSDILGGFDIVLKIKNVHIINNKQSPWISLIEGLEQDSEFASADTILSIGHIQLIFYESSLKKTKKFTILQEHKNLRLFNFMNGKISSRRLLKINEALELRLNSFVCKRIANLWNFMTLQRQQPQQMQQSSIQDLAVKFETIFEISNIQVHLVDLSEQLQYLCDINGVKLQLSNFASVFKQIISFSSATFKKHIQTTGSYITLLSILTSNLFTLEFHALHQKLDYFINGSDIIVRLFNLDESLNGVQDLVFVLNEIRQLNSRQYQSGVQMSPRSLNSFPRPKINIEIKMIEIELIEEGENQESTLALAFQDIKCSENKVKNFTCLSLENMCFKLLENTIFDRIELNYQYNESFSVLNANRIPIEFDVQKMYKLFHKMGKDVNSFFKILSLLGSLSSGQNCQNDLMPQEEKENKKFSSVIQANTISISIGFTNQAQIFEQILTIDIVEPRLILTFIDQILLMQLEFQLQGYLIERMSLQKIPLIEKSKFMVTKSSKSLELDAPNIRLCIFPESIIELRRLQNLTNKENYIPSNFRFNFKNKTMKQVYLYSSPIFDHLPKSAPKLFCTITQNSILPLNFMPLDHNYTIAFDNYSPFQFDLHNMYIQARNQSFFKVYVNLDQRAQFMIFCDLQEGVLTFTLLERYSIINKLSPGMNLEYLNFEVPIQYQKNEDKNLIEFVSSISTSFPDVEEAKVSFGGSLKYAVSEIYDDWIASDITIPCQIFNLPQTQTSQQFEVLILQPFLTLQSLFKQEIQAKVNFLDSNNAQKHQFLVLQQSKEYHMMFRRAPREKKNKDSFGKLSQQILKGLKIELEDKQKYRSEINLGEMPTGTSFIENFSEQQILKNSISKVQIDQAFRYKYQDLGLIWVAESQKCIPITVKFFPQIKFNNQTQDDIYLMMHSFKETEQITGYQAELDQIHKNKVVIAAPNQSIDICSDEPINHYIQVGLKIYNKLILSSHLLTIKNQTHYLTLMDGDIFCLLKVQITYSKDSSTLISVSPLLRLSNQLPSCLALLQTGQGADFQQLLLDKPTLYRLSLSKVTNSIDPSFLNTPAQDQAQVLLNQTLLSLKLLHSEHIEHSYLFTINDSPSVNLGQLLSDSPFDISLLRPISVDFDLEWSAAEEIFMIKLAESQKVVFEMSNRAEETQINLKVGEESIKLEQGEKIQYACEKGVREKYGRKAEWKLGIKIESKKYLLGEINSEIDIDPEQLIEKEKIVIEICNEINIREESFENIPKRLVAEYEKISKKRIALTFKFEFSQNAQDLQKITLTGNLDIKLSLFPFVFQKRAFEHQMLQLSLQEISLSNTFQNPRSQLTLSCGYLSINNISTLQDHRSQLLTLLSTPSAAPPDVSLTTILRLEEGFSFSLDTIQHDENLIIIEEIKFEVPDKMISIAINEEIKYMMAGFIEKIKEKEEEEKKDKVQKIIKKYLLKKYSQEGFNISLKLNLDSKFVLKIQDAQIPMESQSLTNLELIGDHFDFANIAVRHLTLKTFQSLHLLLFHSSFMGNIPSIFIEAKRDASDLLQSSSFYSIMPLANLAAKGFFQFFYNIGSSFGGNLMKFAISSVSTRKTDLQCYQDQQAFYISLNPQWFKISISGLNCAQIRLYFEQIPPENQIILYLQDECQIEAEGKSYACHVLVMSHNIAIVYEAYQKVRMLEFNYKNIRKIQFLKDQEEHVKMSIALKKRAVSKVNESYFQLQNSALSLDLPRRHADSLLSTLKQLRLLDI